MGKPRVSCENPARCSGPLTLLDDYPHPPCAIRRQQEPRNPPNGARSPGEAHSGGPQASPRGRDPTARALTTRRHATLLYIAVSTDPRDDRGSPELAHVGLASTVAVSQTHDQGVRGAAAARAGLWELPAVLGGDGADVAGAGGLWALFLSDS